MARRPLDLRLIPEFGGAATDEPIAEWLERVEMICELSDEDRVERILPLRLTGGALAVYRQLSKEQRADLEEIKRALTTAFAVDAFMAFDQFAARQLRDGETVDEFLAALKRLALQVGEMPPEKWMACAFVSGLPQRVRQQLRASARMDTMTLDQLRARARAILVEGREPGDPTVAAARRPCADAEELIADQSGGNVVCYKCAGPNHLAKDCMQGRTARTGNRVRRSRREIRCFRCQRIGHFASECQGNCTGEKTPAPVSSPGK